ncbi:MAG: VWA domain-containing protein [Leptospiraceae bacterium]|nr:VWA domain-containing protein [Leptospiraceae bacterium]MCP5486037.1 VWA domain-containing protein [Spirochaetales bacterium]
MSRQTKHRNSGLLLIAAGLYLASGILVGLRAAPVELRQVNTGAFPRVELTVGQSSPHPLFVGNALEPADFAIEELMADRVIAAADIEIVSMSDTADRLDLVIVTDATRSVSARNFRAGISAAKALAEGLESGDRIALYSMRGEPRLELDFTSDRAAALGALSGLERNGRRTRVYDSLYSGIYAARSAVDGSEAEALRVRSAVLLITDGRDEGSYLNDNDCFELAEMGRRLEIPIFVLLYGGDGDRRLLTRLALKSGGRLLEQPAPGELGNLRADLRRLAERVYTLRYQSSAPEVTYPGEQVFVRVSMPAGGDVRYAAAASYRVPFGSFFAARPLVLAGLFAVVLVFVLLLLILVFVLYFGWRRRGRIAGDDSPDLELEAEPDSDPTPYIAAGETVPGEIANPSAGPRDPAGMLMEDERTLYMREYNYRVLQLALREARRYGSAMLTKSGAVEGGPQREYDLFLDTTVLGSGRWANIPVHDSAASPVHAKIKKVDSRFVVYDLLSASGVYLNGHKILRPRALNDGDELRIGRTRFTFSGSP